MNAPEIKIYKKSSKSIEKDYFPVYALSKSLECSKFKLLFDCPNFPRCKFPFLEVRAKSLDTPPPIVTRILQELCAE